MHNRISGFLLFFLLLIVTPVIAQDNYEWWNKKHNWDGVSSWSQYLTYSPAHFGPNALPVPEIRDGSIKKRINLETRSDMHLSRGDNTFDLFLKLDVPLFDGRVAIEAFGVPFEVYEMDTLTRDERAVRDRDAEGTAVGDLYISTKIQLLRDHKGWPDLMLGITLRTASGNSLGDARYTDAPGYYFDLSAGKSYEIGNTLFIRPFAMLGFYVWQTNDDIHFQNDAFLYGIGVSLYNEELEFNAKYGGYKGYLGNGDAPMVLRANAFYKWPRTHLRLSFQQGLQDFEYSTISLGAVFFFKAL
jgi:hypothetical protein